MKWLIDIITEAVLARFKNIISEWHGLLADIPEGWVLCDGTNGTPNLKNKFIFGATTQIKMNETGGASSHTHPFTSNTHGHTIPFEHLDDITGSGNSIISTEQGPAETTLEAVTGTTDSKLNIPPYYKLAYIMKT